MGRKSFVVTGAAGHLGSTILRELAAEGAKVRGLVLPGEVPKVEAAGISYATGDVRDLASLRPLLEGLGTDDVVFIHTAAIISIARTMPPGLREVNVDGVRNVLTLCRERGVRRLVHVSSVHAIPEAPAGQTIEEATSFSPDLVRGGYAKTKAEAAQLVLDAARDGLDVVVVFPSGILGPYHRGSNHLSQMVIECHEGRLPACVPGGYDFVDVRDVASGCLAAASRGQSGEGYVLSGHYVTVQELLGLVARLSGRRVPPVVPASLARAAVPFATAWARLHHERPLYTAYSLETLASNGHFSNEKARRELGFDPRPLVETVSDMLAWLEA